MNIQKLISELQERNREEYPVDGFYGHALLNENDLDQLTTDSFNQGALTVIKEIRKVQYGTNGEGQNWVMINDLENLLRTLEAKLKEK